MNDEIGIVDRLKNLLIVLDEAGESLAAIKIAEAIDLLPFDDEDKSISSANDD